jgi:hypothetical protein
VKGEYEGEEGVVISKSQTRDLKNTAVRFEKYSCEI